jgi:hypothetical protein
MTSNYKDIYIRKNPLKEMKCNPLYVDSYKPYMECFENSQSNNPSESINENINGNINGNINENINGNINENINGNINENINGFSNDDNYNYIDDNSEENKIKLLCKDNKYILKNKGIEKMFDLNLNELMNRKKKGEIKNIDMLHNTKIINSMRYDDSRLLSVNKFSNRLMKNLNKKVIKSNELSNLDDPFFSHPAHNSYKWKNSYFSEGWVNNNITNNRHIDYNSILNYRDKKQRKINYNIINYKNK